MWKDARGRAPEEAVGLLLGHNGCAVEAKPLPNVGTRPHARYKADPLSLLAVLRLADAQGMDVCAIYHSHPAGLPLPSFTDKEEATWNVPYVILGLASGQARAFLLPEGKEVKINVEP